jgi:hypothetical protein
MQIALRWLSWLIEVLLDKSGCRHIRRTLIWQGQSGILPRKISILQFHFSRSSQNVVRGEWVFLRHLFECRGRYLIKETLRHHFSCDDLVQLTHASIILHYYLLLIILFIVSFCKLKPIILIFLCFPLFLLLLLIVGLVLLWVISRGLRWQLIVCIAIGVGYGCDR